MKVESIKKKILAITIGIILTLSLLELSVRAIVWLFLSTQQANNSKPISQNNKKPISIVVIGESTTAVAADPGNNFLIQETAYPQQLERYLNEKSQNFAFKVVNKGIMDGNTNKILSEFRQYIKKAKPDYVVTMMGVKDETSTLKNKSETESSLNLNFIFENFKVIQLFKLFIEEYFQIENEKKIDESFFEKIRSVYDSITWELYDNQKNIDFLNEIINLHYKSHYHLQIGEVETAKRTILESINKYNAGHFMLSDIYLRMNLAAEAIKTLERYHDLFPHSGIGVKKLVFTYLKNKDIQKADSLIQKSRKNKILVPEAVQLAEVQLYKEKKKFKLALDKNTFDCTSFFNYHPQIIHLAKNALHKKIITAGVNASWLECNYLTAELYYLSGDYATSEKLIQNSYKIMLNKYIGNELLHEVLAKKNPHFNKEVFLKSSFDHFQRLGEFYPLIKYYEESNRKLELQNALKQIVQLFPQTKQNYEELYQLTTKANAKLIIMQYPTYNLNILREIIQHDSITWVDSQKVFNDNLDSNIFKSRYPYPFNHYTEKGAKLIAKNLGDAILNQLELAK